MNFIKKILLPLSLIFIFSLTMETAVFSSSELDELYSEAPKIYASAKADFGRGSFRGYCGTYVRCQLKAMGIFNGKYDFRGNGNTWYNGFENIKCTSGGYSVYRQSGGDCINKLVSEYGNDLRNIVVSFPIQSHHTAEYPGAGHVFLIYALIDGIAYYSESFSYGSNYEGQIIAEDVNELMARYNSRFGEANGCVMFVDTPIMSTSEKLLYEKQQEEEMAKTQQTQKLLETIEETSDFTFFAKDFIHMSDNSEIIA